MTTRKNRTGPADDGLERNLRALGRLDARDEQFGQHLRLRLLQQAHQQAATKTRETRERTAAMMTTASETRPAVRSRSRGMRVRLVSALAAVAVALGGVATYLHLQAPTPVSAQVILRHTAAALRLADPGQVVHDVSTVHTVNAPGINAGVGGVSASTAPTVTVDRWTQWDASGAVVRDDSSIISGTSATGPVLQHTVQTGNIVKIYDAQSNTTVTMTTTPSGPPPNQVIPDPYNAASLRQFVLDAQAGKDVEARLLPQETIDGATVDVVRVVHTEPADPRANPAVTPRQFIVTLYVDADSYTIRRLILAAVNVKGVVLTASDVQVVTYQIVPASAVPSTVFTLHAPAHARAVTQP